MTTPSAPIVTVILRQMEKTSKPAVEEVHARLRAAASANEGFLGAQDSWWPIDGDRIDLVTVFGFRSQGALERWEAAPDRAALIDELDRQCVGVSDRAAFDGLSVLQPDKAKVRKVEIVAILIALILALGWMADLVLPPLPEPMRRIVIVSVNVCLISYVFLPWSIRLLVRVRKRLSR